MDNQKLTHETEMYFDYIKNRLKNKVVEDNVYTKEVYVIESIMHKPINRDYLKELCDHENIKVWYTSTNDKAGMINWNPSNDIVNFSQKTIDIIIKNNLQLIRRVG